MAPAGFFVATLALELDAQMPVGVGVVAPKGQRVRFEIPCAVQDTEQVTSVLLLLQVPVTLGVPITVLQ
jgi:6,7-dimethyl-8-ribityllumazine synthase